MKKSILSLLIALVFIVVVLGYLLIRSTDEANDLKQQYQKLDEELALLQNTSSNEINDLKNQLSQFSLRVFNLASFLSEHSVFNEYDKAFLEAKEVSSESIIDAVYETDLIPVEGVLGGSQYITKVIVINAHLVFVEFEDGHNAGSMFLSYEITDKVISFSLVSHYIY